MKTVDSDAKRHKAAWSAAAHLGGKDLSMWTSAYPSGFQPYRKSHTNLDLWALAGYDKKYIGSYMNSQSTSYNHPNSAIEPRIPGIFQYYSIAEDELTRVFASKETAQGRWLFLLTSLALIGVAALQILDAAGAIDIGFSDWRPLLYMFIAWSV